MIPILFNDGATSFNTNGIGSLIGTLDANVIEKSDGTFELNMTIDSDSQYFDQIHVGSIIVARPNNWQANQAFVVEEMTNGIGGIVEIYAVHIAEHRSKLIPIKIFASQSSLANALTAIKNNAMETFPFTLQTDKTSTAKFPNEYVRSFREILGGSEGSLLDVYGGEYEFDNLLITLRSKRGQNDGFKIIYGQNLTDINIEDSFDFTNTITGVVATYVDTEDNHVTSAVQYSDYVDVFPYHKTVVIDVSDEYETPPTVATLNTRAKQIVKSLGNPLRNITASFTTLELNDATMIALGDTVNVIHFGYGINTYMRVIEADWNVLLDRYNSVTLGDAKSKLTSAIKSSVGTSKFEVIDDQIVRRLDANDSSITSLNTTVSGHTTSITNLNTTVSAIKTKTDALGTVAEQRGSSTTATTSTYYNLAQITVPAGRWLIVYHMSAGSRSSGYAWCRISTTSKDSNADERYSSTTNGSGYGVASGACIIQQSSQTVWYLVGWQNSGSSIALRGHIKAIRILNTA